MNRLIVLLIAELICLLSMINFWAKLKNFKQEGVLWRYLLVNIVIGFIGVSILLLIELISIYK